MQTLSVGHTARIGLSAQSFKTEFMDKYGRKLDVPHRWKSCETLRQFFQGRDIDGTTVYGAAIYTERGSEGITMGVTNALYNYGFEYENPDQAL